MSSVDPVSGARLVGGEMLQWADLERTALGGAPSVLVRDVLGGAAATGRRVLLLGPRASRLVQELPGGVDVDVLVRGLPDARAISSLAQLRSGVTVLCGSLDRFEPTASYDVVVVLDAPALLLSPDSDGLTGGEVLRRAAGWLTPDGSLVAVVENDLGLDRLLRLEVRDLYDDDDAWWRGSPGFDDRPAYHRELAALLDSAGLVADATYGAFPSSTLLSLLVSTEATSSPELATMAAAMVSRAEGAHFADHPALADPYALTLRVFDSGLALQLASAWVVVARRTGSAAAAPSLPAVISSEESGRRDWRAVTTVHRGPDGWLTGLRPLQAGSERRERRVARDWSALDTQVAAGPTLEAELRRASVSGDVSAVRQLVKVLWAWLQDGWRLTGTEAEGRFFCTPANLVLSGGDLRPLDASWRLSQPLEDDVLLVRSLRAFAGRLLASGAEHPWAPDISPDSLTQTLCSMVGVPVTSGVTDIVARLESELQVVVQGGDASAEALAYARNLERGRSQFVSLGGPSRGYREALSASTRLAQSLHEREGQVEWLEASLRSRDVQVAELTRTVGSLRSSASFTIGRFFTWPLRSMVGGVRRLALSAIPHGYLAKAQRLLAKVAQDR